MPARSSFFTDDCSTPSPTKLPVIRAWLCEDHRADLIEPLWAIVQQPPKEDRGNGCGPPVPWRLRSGQSTLEEAQRHGGRAAAFAVRTRFTSACGWLPCGRCANHCWGRSAWSFAIATRTAPPSGTWPPTCWSITPPINRTCWPSC